MNALVQLAHGYVLLSCVERRVSLLRNPVLIFILPLIMAILMLLCGAQNAHGQNGAHSFQEDVTRKEVMNNEVMSNE
jgi:hypothetical protein